MTNSIDTASRVWRYRVPLMTELAAYIIARRTFWVTTEQLSRARAMFRKFLSPTMAKDILDRHKIIGGGITPLVRPAAIPDSEVKKRLQTKNRDFRISFIGRFTSNKRISQIFDMLLPMFTMHGIGLEVVTTGDLRMSSSYKRIGGVDDARNLIVTHEKGGRKGREYYAQQILPRLQCCISATLLEAHPSVPREAIYVGIPFLLPDRPWARAMFRDVYPFYYRNESECVALAKRIKNGNVSDSEVDRFNQCRHDSAMIEFMDETSARMYKIFCKDIETDVMPRVVDRKLTRLEEGFFRVTTAGKEFYWTDMCKQVARKELSWGTRTKDIGKIDGFFYLAKHFEVINPKTGLLRRLQ